MDWRPLIGDLIASKSAIFEVDQGLIFRYALPKVRATPTDIEGAERRLRRRLEAAYREFLHAANGIPAMIANDDLFGTVDLGQGRWRQATEYMSWLRRSSPEFPAGELVMPIGMAEGAPSLIMLGSGDDPSKVTWFYSGSLADEWPDLASFFRGAVEMNRQTLKSLLMGPLKDELEALRRLAPSKRALRKPTAGRPGR